MLRTRPAAQTAALCALLALFALVSGCRPGAGAYAPTQEVHIAWGGTWYAGHVLEVGAGETAGRYKVHYDGWSDSWDTWVTPDKLRLPSAGVATGSRQP